MTLFGIRVFVATIKVKISKCNHCGLGPTLNPITHGLKKTSKKETQARGRQCEDRGRDQSDVAASQELLAPTARGRDTVQILTKPPEETNTVNTLVLDFRPPEL